MKNTHKYGTHYFLFVWQPCAVRGVHSAMYKSVRRDNPAVFPASVHLCGTVALEHLHKEISGYPDLKESEIPTMIIKRGC